VGGDQVDRREAGRAAAPVRHKLPSFEPGSQLSQELFRLSDGAGCSPIESGSPGARVVRDLIPRHDEEGWFVHEVVQIVEPPIGIGP
jgi:hypothetical protein